MQLRDRTVHHPRKTAGMEVTVEDLRGGSALVAGTRVARVFNRMTPSEAAKAGIKGNGYRRHFRMALDKINLTPPEDDTTWRYLDSVTFPNGDPEDIIDPEGDSVRVVTRWEWPNAFAGLTREQIVAFQDGLDCEQRLIRVDPQSPDWAGFLLARILNIDCAPFVRRKGDLSTDQIAARARCKELIKVWVDFLARSRQSWAVLTRSQLSGTRQCLTFKRLRHVREPGRSEHGCSGDEFTLLTQLRLGGANAVFECFTDSSVN